jgi:hypothetical protein
MSATLENVIHERLRGLPPEMQQKVLEFVEELGKGSTGRRTLGQMIDEHFQNVPAEEMEELPDDASTNLDRYLY